MGEGGTLDRDLVFRVIGRGDWEQRKLMMSALCMVKGVKEVQGMRVGGEAARSCAEAKKQWEEIPVYTEQVMDEIQKEAAALVALLTDRKTEEPSWNIAMWDRLCRLWMSLVELGVVDSNEYEDIPF